jgi:serine/threonine protein kinase
MLQPVFARAGHAHDSIKSRITLPEAVYAELKELRRFPAMETQIQGSYAQTAIINDIVFKAPVDDYNLMPFEREIQIMRGLTGKVAKTPDLVHVGEKHVFYGMTKIEGIALTPAHFKVMTKGHQVHLAKEIAEVYSNIADAFKGRETEIFSVDKKYGIPSEAQLFKSTLHEIKLRFPGKLGLGELVERVCANEIGNYVDMCEKIPPTLFHGDLKPENIIVNAKTGRLEGLVDLGSVRFVNPATEFSHNLETYSENFLRPLTKAFSAAQGHGTGFGYKNLLQRKLGYELATFLRLLDAENEAGAARQLEVIKKDCETLAPRPFKAPRVAVQPTTP